MKAAPGKLSRVVTWAGLFTVGILAVPTGLLVLLITGTWKATDRLTALLDKKTGK